MTNDAFLTVGIYQPDARSETPEDRLVRLAEIFEDTGARECDLLLCPELYMSGYFVDDKIIEWAQPSTGAFAERVCEIARTHRCAIVYGYPEQADGKVFNSALCAGPDGRVAANHRKNLLPYDYEEKYFQPGRQPTSFLLKGWKVGMVICYELEFPEPARYYALSGCDLVLAPTALTEHWPVVAHRVVPARAFENNIYVAYANHCGEEGGNRYLGHSVIASPYGEDAARAGSEECVISARLDRVQIVKARSRLHFLEDVGQSCYR
ncbi:MAG: carbon-nitrogen hydrolase family protein [Arenicellales bacterium]